MTTTIFLRSMGCQIFLRYKAGFGVQYYISLVVGPGSSESSGSSGYSGSEREFPSLRLMRHVTTKRTRTATERMTTTAIRAFSVSERKQLFTK